MKIIAYGVRIDEVKYLDDWAKETGNTVEQHTDYLNVNTVEWAKGFDGINVLQTTPYSAAMFEKLNEYGIKYIALRNVGTDNVDLDAAKKAGVRISNVPAYSPTAIAEFSLTMALHLLRNVGYVQNDLKNDDFAGASTHIGRELGQSVVGVIGTGRIGQAAVKMFNGFGAKVLAYDPYPAKNTNLDMTYVSLDELLSQADVIDLHVPGIPANDHIIDARAFDLMKPGVVILNTARGNLIDTNALLANLKSGKLAGAGIDTYEYETEDLLKFADHGNFNDPIWDELLAMPNVVLSPHIAYYTETAVHNMVYFSMANLVSFIEKGEAETEVKF